MHKKYSRESLSFISGVALLLVGLDSTPTELHWNTSMAPLPTSLVITPKELLASPLHAGSLSLLPPYSFFILIFYLLFIFFIFIFPTVHITYSFQGQKRDPDLLRAEEVVPAEK